MWNLCWEGSREEKQVFGYIWKSPTPSKVVAFSWQLLLDHIPMGRNLAYKNILPENASTSCVLCDKGEEGSRHVFLHREVTSAIWVEAMKWLGFTFINLPNMFVHWECWNLEGKNEKIRSGFWLIWHATIWVIWQSRNEIFF